MSARLCIDFGTSSIRAAVRASDSARPQVLPLGKAIKTKARDEASLLSEIYIDSKKSIVIFGERALACRQQNLTDPYPIQSPKIWLKDPSHLKLSPFTDLPFTKVELLAGLLSYAIQAARISLKGLGIKFSPNQGNITVAHPVWPQEIEGDANRALAEILTRAISIQDHFIDELAFKSLKSRSSIGEVNHDVDVVEPIAAAYELSTVESNLRRLTLVVDVGAGTTDIGLFVHVESSLPQDRLIPLFPVRSEFYAGDLIDETLLRLLQKKASSVNALAVTEVRRRIRVVKETLFQQGRIFELGVELDLAELEESEEIKSMQTRIRLAAEEILSKNAQNIIEWTTAASFHLQFVEVLMAGGGASIGFIHRALENGFYPLEKSRVLLRVVKHSPNRSVKTYGASVERLAVALGGADTGYENLLITMGTLPLERREVPNLRSSLGEPKQTFGSHSKHKASESSAYQVSGSVPPGPTAEPRLSESSYNRLIGEARSGSKPSRDVNNIEAYGSAVVSVVQGDQVKQKTSQSGRQTPENHSGHVLRIWDKKRADLMKSSCKDSAEDQYKLACHLLEYPIQGSSPYKKSAIESLTRAASLGSYVAASKLSSLYGEPPVTKENSASGYYWYLVAEKLGKRGRADVDPSVFIEELTEVEQNLASEMASKFRVLSSKPTSGFIRGSPESLNGKSREIKTTRHRGAPQSTSNVNQGYVLASGDQLIVLSLLKTSRNLRTPGDSDLASTSSIIRWARTSDFRSAMFLALRFCPSLNTHDLFNRSDVYEQVKAWIEFAKRYERKR